MRSGDIGSHPRICGVDLNLGVGSIPRSTPKEIYLKAFDHYGSDIKTTLSSYNDGLAVRSPFSHKIDGLLQR